MKNLVLNLRNANAQAGCAKSSRMAKLLTTLLFLTLGVGQMWALDIYLDISAANWPKDGATIKLYPGTGSDITGTSVATNLYKFTVTSATGTMWFKRMSGSSTWNQGSVTYNSSYNLYKLTGWDAAACSNANISTATKTNYIYFDNSVTNWSNSYKYFVIGHDYPSAYSKVYSMSALGHTKLWYVSQSSDSWTDLTYYAICSPTSSWSGTSWGSSNISNANKYAAPYKGKYDMNNGSSYLFTPASSSNNCALTIDYKDGYSALNYSQTVKKYTSTDGGSTYSAASINSGTVTITPYKLTNNGTVSNSSNTGTLDEASETSVSKDAVYTGEVTVTASANSGYTFVGWFTAASGGSAVSTDASYTYNAPKSTNTIYARFKNETTYTITIANSVNASTSTVSVGATPVQITAPDIDGYEFSSWSAMPSGVTKTSGELTDESIYISATKAATVTANYTEDLSSPWTIKGGTNITGNNWSTAYNMTKKSGHSTESVVYYTFNISSTNSGVSGSADDWSFKVSKDGSTWYGLYASGSYWWKRGTSNQPLNGEQNIQICADVAGPYEIKVDYTTPASPKVTVTFPTKYTVTYSVSPSGAASAITTSPNVSSGGEVASGTSITFTHAAANTGYTWYRWENGSGSSLGTGSTYNTTITANTTVVAKYTENTYSVTVNKNPAAGGSVTPTSVTAMGQVNGGDITATPNTGYNFTNWTITSGTGYFGSTGTSTTSTTKNTKFRPTAAATIQANFTAKQYTITLNNNGGEGGTSSVKATYNSSSLSTAITNPTRTGYTFNGWHKTNGSGQLIINTAGALQAGTDYTGAGGIWTNDGAVTLYAGWTPKTCTVTFDYQSSAEGYGTSGTLSNVTATYDAAMPALTGNMPTAANGYAFMGFFSETGGNGTKYYSADKSSAHNWDVDTESTTTLYAYYKKAEITVAIDQSVFEPVAAGGSSWVIANPTVAPKPVGDTKICWALLYDDENPVPAGHEAEEYTESGTKPNQVRFNLAGLAAGSYRIRATLRTGSSCDGGTLLSTFDKSVTIATDFKVTVRYMCGTEEIKASEIVDGHAMEWTDISAPDIMGYAFSTWDLGDGGLTTDKALTLQSGFRFKATYSGTLTAQYTKKKYIYLDLSQQFSESGKWNNPYCYIYNSSSSWDDSKGTGATGTMHCIAKGAMTQITGTNIWYYDYSSYTATFANKVAFTWGDKTSQEYFYAVDVIYRADFSEGTPLFIPAVGQNKEVKNSNAKYYNRGYWTNYTGSKTGYTLLIYNSSDVEIKRIPFNSVSNDMRMTMKATVDLEATTTYKVEILRDNGHYYKNSAARNYSNSQDNWEYLESSSKGNLVTTAAGDYVFTLSYTDYTTNNTPDKNYQIRMKVDYPAAVNDFQVMYNDNATWSLGTAHGSGWRHPSRMIKARANGVDTISFFVAKTNSPKLYARKVTNASSMTWASLNIAGAASMNLSVDSSAVYNFKVTQGSAGVISSIENIGAYTGEYYIRCDAMNSKWDNYTSDNDHRMTYSSFSESDANAFGEKFSHYKAKWCKYGKNVKFVIANDYSPCISDTLTQDVPNTYNNIDSYGFLKDDGTAEETQNIYSANIRFMWNRKTNKISRAYVASSTNPERLFLVLRGNYAIKSIDNEDMEDEGTGIPSVILQDDQNWMYEEILYIKPGTRFKLYACYAQVSANPNGAQYFRGAYDSNRFTTDANSVILIDGDGDYQKARVLYDFKTNRLICAWLPSNADVSGTNNINADVMIIREHQEAAQYITFADADSKLTGVKTVYGVMKFNRWVLNNRKSTGTHQPLDVGDQKSEFERSLYFISFPFDVRVSDIFGFGHYWDEWYLEYYDGLTRAKNGFWIDSPPNWKYVTPEMATNYVLKANEGYILGLDLEYMPYNNEEFWAHDIETIELFFPSTAELATLQQTTCTIPALSSDYKCTIKRTGEDGDRRVKDSYWRCIGTPSLNLYNTAVTDGSGNAISWKTDYTWHADEREFPFIYMWNKTDNTLTPQSTSTFNFLPMHSYLVQNGGQIVWTNVSAKPSSIVARNADDTPAMSYNWRLALISDTTLIDQTYVRMNNLEQVTDTFDFGQDMSKEFNAYRSDIYTKIGYERVAANSMPLNTETTTIVPVGIKVYKAGEFKLAMPDGTDGIGITLVDNETGIRTQLGALDYTVTLDKGTYDERFYLEISPIHNTPTDLGGVNSNQPSAVRKVIIDQNMYIIRDGKMYNVQGARCN